jgi:alpha-beta hydrolase superfamily lysophospholipase
MPRLIREAFTLYNHSGDAIRGDVRMLDSNVANRPVVIVCHSFMAFKDWGFFPYVCERIAEAGFVSVIFNVSHSGVEEDGTKITDFEKFQRNTFTQELEDLRIVIDAVVDGTIARGGRQIILVGHSRGGGIAIVTTAEDRRVTGLATWSSISTFDRWTEHQKERWRRAGYLPLAKDSTRSPLRLGIGLLEDLERNEARLNLIDAAARIRVPWLIVHGKADVTVPSREAERLYANANRDTSELLLLDGVGHLYHAETQEEDSYRTLNHIVDVTTTWIFRHIG